MTQEEGIDLSGARPQKLTSELAAEAQLLVTMGCGDECPYIPGVRCDDWPLNDPKGQPVDRVRAIRHDIRARVAALVFKKARDKQTVCHSGSRTGGTGDLSRREPRGQAPSDEDHVIATAGGHL